MEVRKKVKNHSSKFKKTQKLFTEIIKSNIKYGKILSKIKSVYEQEISKKNSQFSDTFDKNSSEKFLKKSEYPPKRFKIRSMGHIKVPSETNSSLLSQNSSNSQTSHQSNQKFSSKQGHHRINLISMPSVLTCLNPSKSGPSLKRIQNINPSLLPSFSKLPLS